MKEYTIGILVVNPVTMLTLYVRTGCPFCEKVQQVITNFGIVVEEKNIANPDIARELIALGGKQQVPYLVDTDHNVAMYESDDIVAYLTEHYIAPK